MFKKMKSVIEKHNLLNTIGYLTRIICQEKKSYLLVMLSEVIFKVLLNVWRVWMPMCIVEALTKKNYQSALLAAGIFLSGEFICNIILGFLDYRAQMTEEWFDCYFSEEYSRRCMEVPYQYTETKEKLDEIKNAKDGLDWSGNVACIIDSLKEVVAAVISIVSVFAIVFEEAPLLVVMVTILVLVKAKIEKNELNEMEHYYGQLSGLNRKMDYYFYEISNDKYGKDIRLYRAKDLLLNRAGMVNQENAEKMKTAAHRVAKLRCKSSLLEEIITAMQYLYVGFFTILNNLGAASFTMLIGSTAVMAASMEKMFEEYQNMILGSTYFSWYSTFISKKDEEICYGNEQIAMKNDNHVIQFQNVSFKYPGSGQYVLKDVSFEIRSGDKISLVGLNGEGKTTLVKLLCGLYPVSSGSILLDGKDILQYDRKEFCKFVSVVFQDFVMFARPLLDNITFTGQQEEERVNALLKQLNMFDKVRSLPKGIHTNLYKEFDEQGYEPSGGESQKLALARALYRNSDMLVLDEPTAALDPVSEDSLYQDIRRIMKEKTILFVSHRLASCRFCDKILVLHEGRIFESGSHDALMKIENGLYRKMFQAQAESYVQLGDGIEQELGVITL